jgi:outer membrane lipoprotein LolB
MMGHASEKPIQSGMFSFFKHFIIPVGGLILCIALFAGCTTLTPKHAAVNTIIVEPVAGAVEIESTDFELIGRISVKGGKESFSSGVQWRHNGESDEILLLSPLGQVLAQIKRAPEGVHLTTSEQKSYHAADVESLTEQVLGWRLPLMGLQYWVQSVNSPATASAIDMDIDGRIVAIRQDGWEINYLSYFPILQTQASLAQTARPRLLTLERSDLQIKLIIDNWNPDSNY